MRKWLIIIAALFTAPGVGWAQSAIQQSPSRLDAGQLVQYDAGSINEAQKTLTIPAGGGNICAYIDSMIVAVGQNATGTTGVQSFTTTNLNGLGWTFYTIAGGSAPYQMQLVGATPLKVAACGTATTLVSPAQNANLAYPMLIQYHYGQPQQGG